MANAEAISNEENIPIAKQLSDNTISHPNHVSPGVCTFKEEHERYDRNDSATDSNGDIFSREKHEEDGRGDSTNASHGDRVPSGEHKKEGHDDSTNPLTGDKVAKEGHDNGVHDDDANASKGLHVFEGFGVYRNYNSHLTPEAIGPDTLPSSSKETSSIEERLYDIINTLRKQDIDSVGELKNTTTDEEFWEKYGTLVYQAKHCYPAAIHCPVNGKRMRAIKEADSAKNDKELATKAYWKFSKAVETAMKQAIRGLGDKQRAFVLDVYRNIVGKADSHTAKVIICNMVYAPKCNLPTGGVGVEAGRMADRWRNNHKALIDDMSESHTDEEFWTSLEKYMNEGRDFQTCNEVSTPMRSMVALVREGIARKDKKLAIRAYDRLRTLVANEIDRLVLGTLRTAERRVVRVTGITVSLPPISESTPDQTVTSTSAYSTNGNDNELKWRRSAKEDVAIMQAAMEGTDDDYFWDEFSDYIDRHWDFFESIMLSTQRKLFEESRYNEARAARDKNAAMGAYHVLNKLVRDILDAKFASMSVQDRARTMAYYDILTREHKEEPLTMRHLSLKN